MKIDPNIDDSIAARDVIGRLRRARKAFHKALKSGVPLIIVAAKVNFHQLKDQYRALPRCSRRAA